MQPAPAGVEPAFLYLTSTRRKRDQVLREFEGRDVFHPEVHVLADWWAAWWRRWGDGRVVASQRTLALAAWRLLDSRPGMWPTIDAVPDRAEAAWALAALDQQLDAAAAPRPVADPAVNQAIGALRAAITRTGRLVRRTEAQRLTIDRLDSDGITGAPPRVIVDDLFGLTDLDGALLAALCRAWDRAGADVILATASGRDRGGLEVPALLGVTGLDDIGADDADLAAGIDRELRVFSATRTVRRAALELVSTGEAAAGVATDDGWAEVEPWSEPWTPPAPDLADHYAAGAELPIRDAAEALAFAGAIRIARPPDRDAEARSIARQVADALRDGVDPRVCAIAAPDPAAVVAALAHALADHGVAYTVHGGDPVAVTPVGGAVRWLTSAALDGYGPDPVCGLADLLAWPMPLDPRAIRRFCAAADVRSGHPSTWAAALGRWAERTRAADGELLAASIAALGRLADALAPLAEDQPPGGWHLTLHRVADAVGLPARCQVLGEPALAAWAAIAEAAALLARDLALVEPGPWPAARLREAWDRALDAATAEPTDRGLARVPIVPLSELCGLAPARVFVVGLSRGSTPRRRPAFLDPTQPTPPDRDPDAVARYVLASLLREALDPDGTLERLVLSWPATERGARVAPAAVLAELLDLPSQSGASLGALLVDDADPGPTLAIASRSEALAAAARAAGGDGDGEPLVGLGLDRADAARLGLQVEAVRDREGRLGARDGMLDPPPPAPAALPVTAVDTYLACPARYWYGHVLGLAPPDATRPELEPRRRGIAVHRILERFVRERQGGALPDPDAERRRLRALLHAIASEVLDAVESEGGFDPMFHGYARSRWLAGLVDDKPSGMLRAWLDAEAERPDLVPEDVELRFDGLAVGPVAVRGVIDRVDRLPNGARLVTDYKTGTPPTRARVEAGLAFQGLAYAAHVEAATGAPVASAFLSLARPDAIRRTTFAGDPAALDAACTSSERRTALDLDADARAARIADVGRALDRLVAGAFPPTPHGRTLAGCPRCPFRRVCRLDELRHATRGPVDADADREEPG